MCSRMTYEWYPEHMNLVTCCSASNSIRSMPQLDRRMTHESSSITTVLISDTRLLLRPHLY